MDWIERLKHSTGITKMIVAEKSNKIFNNFMKVSSINGRNVIIETDNHFHMVDENYFKNNFGLNKDDLERCSKIIVEKDSGKVIVNRINDIEDMFNFR